MNPGELCEQLERYLALRRAVGFKMQYEERLLRDFITFIERHEQSGSIQARHAIEWACSTAHRYSHGWQAQRLSVARGFLSFLRASVSGTEVPGPRLLRSSVRPKPYVFTKEEIQALIGAARRLGPARSLRPYTIETLIGLLASTGLRTGEAIRLQTDNVILNTDVPRLEVRQTKFRKSRLVPIHHTTANALRLYAQNRRDYGCDGICGSFFVSERSGQLNYSTVKSTFVTIIRQLGICASKGERSPSLHSLRHSFVVLRLTDWYREEADIPARLPELSVYIGHVNPQQTYWYLTATPQLLETAGKLFEAHVEPGGMR